MCILRAQLCQAVIPRVFESHFINPENRTDSARELKLIQKVEYLESKTCGVVLIYCKRKRTSPGVQFMLFQFIHSDRWRSVVHLEDFNEISNGKHADELLLRAVP